MSRTAGGVPTTYVPDEDHVLRHVPKRAVEWDAEDPTVAKGFLYAAFTLRDGESELSSGWIEFPEHQGSFDEKLKQTKLAFHQALNIKKNDRFALGNVGAIKGACQAFNVTVRITHEPDGDFTCHAAVRRFRDDNRLLLDLLASEAWAQMHTVAP